MVSDAALGSRWVYSLFQENVLGLQVAMYEPSLIEKTQTVQQLLCKDAD